ncbi:MAG: sigma-70 family RNA polymerase sigma factor [Hyphomicrobiales bacterium]|nr:MAG: sigma-70 family RNA polymerase sigma factor [Hyphomicrobiales bacterium]
MAKRTDFERIAVPHLDAAYTLAVWLLRSRADAEDVVQEAFLRAFRAFGNFRGGDVRPWLLAIVRNAAYRELGHRKKSAAVVSLDEILAQAGSEGGRSAKLVESLVDKAASAEAQMIRGVDEAILRRALAELPETFREVIVLREIEELSYRDIAQVIGAPEGTVMSRLSRARTELRDIMKRLIAKEEGHAM